MNHLKKLNKSSLLKWVSSKFPENRVRSTKIQPFLPCTGPLHTAKNPTFFSSRAAKHPKNQILKETMTSHCHTGTRIGRNGGRIKARAALLEYLHCTRSLPFIDAEYISSNSPSFVDKLLKKVENEQDIGRALTKFFHYHPINEFEPFFESMGLQPSEFSALLPRELMFLCDDNVLLENWHTLCDFGVCRSKLGKMYKEAAEIFRYNDGVLRSKLQAYEDLGLSHYDVIKFVTLSPSLLVGDVNRKFVKVLDVLMSLGIECDWIEGHLFDGNSYEWSQMYGFLSFFCQMGGCSKEELGGLIRKHPNLVLDGSGKKAFSLIGLLLKLGFTMNEIYPLFLKFPRVQVGTFVKNLRQGLLFFMEIEMEAEDIGRIVHGHTIMLGSFSLKKSKTVLSKLSIGKKRLCGIIKDDPLQLKNWILGLKLNQLPDSGEEQRSLMQKTEFLLSLGFVENSKEMNKAQKVFRGKGGELQERFDYFVQAGLDRKDVTNMIKVAPQVLNLSKDAIEAKIDFLINGLGYPISSLLAFPSYVCFTIQRVKLRFSMYNWLKDEGVVTPMLALSTILACSDKAFIKQYVSLHPKGLEIWENLKKAYQI